MIDKKRERKRNGLLELRTCNSINNKREEYSLMRLVFVSFWIILLSFNNSHYKERKKKRIITKHAMINIQNYSFKNLITLIIQI